MATSVTGGQQTEITLTDDEIGRIAAALGPAYASVGATEKARMKMELVRVAKEILTENQRNLPVGDRSISASDITTLADTLNTYII